MKFVKYRAALGRLLRATAVLLALCGYCFPANANLNGQVIREARCKLLIRGSVDANIGDVVNVVRKGSGASSGNVIGQVVLLKFLENRVTARVVDSRSDCRRFLGGFIVAKSNEPVSRVGRRSGPPPMIRTVIAAGGGIVSSALKGTSRATTIESYPLVLQSFGMSADVFPFSFTLPPRSPSVVNWKSIFGLEGGFRYVTSLTDVRVTAPSLTSGQEVGLDLGLSRLTWRGGVLARVPLWKGRLFLDSRTGYYYHRLTSSISKFVQTPENESKPFELSPLRDLNLGGFYFLGGLQFQPVDTFRVRLNAGTLLAPTYVIDNRLPDAALNGPSATGSVTAPRIFLIDTSFNYLFAKLQVGLDLAVESFSGRALFPDGKNEGGLAELYSTLGLNVAFLL
ncbi:MAG: hypothetical protein RLZZ488_2418 [Pseudomonadota bacterium]